MTDIREQIEHLILYDNHSLITDRWEKTMAEDTMNKLLAVYKAAIPIAAWLAVGDDDRFVDTDITDTFILAMSRVQTND